MRSSVMASDGRYPCGTACLYMGAVTAPGSYCGTVINLAMRHHSAAYTSEALKRKYFQLGSETNDSAAGQLCVESRLVNAEM